MRMAMPRRPSIKSYSLLRLGLTCQRSSHDSAGEFMMTAMLMRRQSSNPKRTLILAAGSQVRYKKSGALPHRPLDDPAGFQLNIKTLAGETDGRNKTRSRFVNK